MKPINNTPLEPCLINTHTIRLLCTSLNYPGGQKSRKRVRQRQTRYPIFQCSNCKCLGSIENFINNEKDINALRF